jgi:hypothetical protein
MGIRWAVTTCRPSSSPAGALSLRLHATFGVWSWRTHKHRENPKRPVPKHVLCRYRVDDSVAPRLPPKTGGRRRSDQRTLKGPGRARPGQAIAIRVSHFISLYFTSVPASRAGLDRGRVRGKGSAHRPFAGRTWHPWGLGDRPWVSHANRTVVPGPAEPERARRRAYVGWPGRPGWLRCRHEHGQGSWAPVHPLMHPSWSVAVISGRPR